MILRTILPLLLACLALAGEAFAQEQAFTNRATELKENPAPEARTIASLAAESPLKVLARQGAWTQVEAGGQRGWLRAFHIRFQSTVQTTSSGSSVGGLTSMLGLGPKKGPETSRVATVGIRGLAPEDFKNAAPDPAALRKLQSYRSDRASAERFAKEAKLNAVRVNYAGGR
jgi:hypothetical protein